MKDICRQIQEQIPLYIDGHLSKQQVQKVLDHIAQCEQCKEYLQALEQDDRMLSSFVESMRPSIGRVEKEVKQAVEGQQQSRIAGTAGVFKRSKFVPYAAAAVVFIAVGFLVGRVSKSQPVNIDQLRNELKVSLSSEIRKEVSEQLKGDLQAAFAAGFEQVKDRLRNEYQQELNRYAIQTLAASSAVTNQLLTELIATIDKSRERDLRRIAVAMEQVELNRMRDSSELRNSFTTFASYTGNELTRTRNEMAELLSYTRPSDAETQPN
jgi:uncharacterized membrane-anchored protein YhcB (DUF1043 family)